jgi:hypothetical protein
VSTRDAKIVQSTGDFPNQILIQFWSIAKQSRAHTTPFDTRDARRTHHPEAGTKPIGRLRLWRPCVPLGGLLGVQRRSPVWILPWTPSLFLEGARRWPRRPCFLRPLGVMTVPRRRLAHVMAWARRDAAQTPMRDRRRFFFPLSEGWGLARSCGRGRGRAVPSRPEGMDTTPLASNQAGHGKVA